MKMCASIGFNGRSASPESTSENRRKKNGQVKSWNEFQNKTFIKKN